MVCSVCSSNNLPNKLLYTQRFRPSMIALVKHKLANSYYTVWITSKNWFSSIGTDLMMIGLPWSFFKEPHSSLNQMNTMCNVPINHGVHWDIHFTGFFWPFSFSHTFSFTMSDSDHCNELSSYNLIKSMHVHTNTRADDVYVTWRP